MRPLDLWTVYDSPSDYPGLYVARRWEVGATTRATPDVLTAGTLDALRAKLPPGLALMHRHAGDDSVIVECWL